MVRFIMALTLLVSLWLGLATRGEGGQIVIHREAVGTDGRFPLELFAELRAKPGNLNVSPASVAGALSLTYEGARGETAEEIARVLHLPADREAMRRGVRTLRARINGDGSPRPYRLVAADSLWAQRGEPLLPAYVKAASETFGAAVESVDFARDPAGSLLAINGRVSRDTNGLIPSLLNPADLVPPPSLVLVNTLYLKAPWAIPFSAEATHPAPFHTSGGKPQPVPTMRQTASLPYAEAKDVQVLGLPYKGDDLAMVVLLPRAVDGLDTLEAGLTPATLDGWVAALSSRKVAVELPKFKVKTAVELSEPLKALGIRRAFTNSADFGGIDGRRDLAISKVIHQVVVDVDEAGTEAAAATAVLMPRSAAISDPPVVFRADHPFLYLIRDVKTGAILFLGRVADPAR